jgi:hypothetical protein
MTTWVECNHPQDKSKSQASMGEEDFQVGRKSSFYSEQEVRKSKAK